MSRYSIEDSTLKGIADAVRNMRKEKDLMTTKEIISKINASTIGIPIKVGSHINSDTGEWVRPKEWPNLDLLSRKLTDEESAVYLTYDLTKTPDYGWIGLYVKTENNEPCFVVRGHVVQNENFVEDESFSVPSNSNFVKKLDSANGNVQVWKIYSADRIKKIGFCAGYSEDKPFQNILQPCVERSGFLPYCEEWFGFTGNQPNQYSGGTAYLERDSLVPGKFANVKTLYNCWNGCYSLQSLDLSGWNTDNWEVNNLSNCFAFCYSLQSLDLSGWKTDNWKVNNLSGCWSRCYSLQSLDVSSWKTDNWAVSDLSNCWYYCFSLQSLDLSGWKTDNWVVKTLRTCWSSCHSLQSLDVSSWKTDNWSVTSLYNCWYYCFSLQSLDLSGWKTDNWPLTTLANCWRSCYSLRSLDVSSWKTGNWSLTTMENCWVNCFSLQSLDLSGWKTDNWPLATLGNCWNSCYSLRSLDVSGWKTDNWSVTSLSNCWASCYSLQSLDLSGWKTDNWPLTTLANCWNSCYLLESLKGTDKIEKISSLTSDVYVPNIPMIMEFDGIPVSIDHSYADAILLTRESLIKILETLPRVSVKRTLTLGSSNFNKLTSDEITIATNKGWTVVA